MTAKPFPNYFWLSLLFVILGYLCNLQANAILLTNLNIDTFGDFSCAWRALGLFAQIMLLGSSYTRYYYDKRAITPRFLLSHRPLVVRSFITVLTVYCLFWLFTLHAHEGNFSQLPSYHLVYFASIFAILQTCVIVLERFIATLGFTLYTHFSSDFLHYLIKLLVIAVGFQVYQPSTTPDLTAFIAAFLILMALCDILSIKLLTRNSATYHQALSSSKTRNNKATYPLTWHNLRKDPAAATVVARMSSYAPIYLIEIFSPHEHLVGLYSICMILISFIAPLLSRIGESAHNMLLHSSAYETAAKKRQLHKKLSNIAAVRVSLILLSYLLYSLFHDRIFSAFSIDYFHDTKLIALMLVVVYLEDIANHRVTFLYSHNQTRFCFWVNCAILSLTISLGILLIGPYSLTGVVLASIISQLTRVTLLSYACAKHSNLHLHSAW